MKRIISVFLVLSLVLLCGCSSVESVVEQVYENKGLVEITGIDESDYDIVASCINDDVVTLLISTYTQADETDETSENEESCDENFISNYYLYSIKAKSSKVIRKACIDDTLELEGLNGIKYDENGRLLIYDEYDKQAAVYTSNFEFVENEEYSYTETVDLYKDNEFYNDSFATYDYCARYSSYYTQGESFDVIIFPDENDCFYYNFDHIDDILAGSDKKILACNYNDYSIDLAIYDLESSVKINTTSSENFEDISAFPCPINAVLNDKYVFVNLSVYDSENDKSTNHLYIWEYKTCAKNEQVTLDKVDSAGLTERIETLSQELKDNYKIDVKIDQSDNANADNIDSDEGTGVQFGATPLKTYYILTQFSKFLTYFPAGLFDEIYEEYENSDGLDLYIVKEIDGDSAAYANIWGDKPLITFATEEFSFYHMPHEFMHILDIKLFNYYERNGKSFWNEWEKYNPDDFYYSSDNDYNEEMVKYFISAYSMTDQQEDRAELFQNMFQDADCDNKPEWVTIYPILNKKATYLCDALREAYPSLNKSTSLYWEKWLTVE